MNRAEALALLAARSPQACACREGGAAALFFRPCRCTGAERALRAAANGEPCPPEHVAAARALLAALDPWRYPARRHRRSDLLALDVLSAIADARHAGGEPVAASPRLAAAHGARVTRGVAP